MTPGRNPWLELALRAYPRAFRRRFGDEIRDDVRNHAGLRLYLRLVASGLAERWAAVARIVGWSTERHHLYHPIGRRAMTWELLWMDVRHTARMFRRMPGFTAMAVVVLALGIAINIAVFSVIHAVLLRPLPYDRPEQLVMVWSMDREAPGRREPVAAGDFQDFASLQSFAGLAYALSFLNPMLIAGQEEAGPVQLLRVSPDFLELIGRPAALGRIFGSSDASVAVISDRLWQRRFNRDPAVIGRVVTLSGREQLEIVGVMPPDFSLPLGSMLGAADPLSESTADIWVPMLLEGARWRTPEGTLVRHFQALAVVGRLVEGLTLDRAAADVRLAAQQLEQAYPATNKGRGGRLVPLPDQVVGEIRPALLVLMSAVAVLLLMAAGNVANLVLAHSVSRQGEFAVRAALGATRLALVRQVLVEGVALACAGGLLGVLVGGWMLRILMRWAPPGFQALTPVPVDGLFIAFVAALVLATGVAVGLVPAIVAARGSHSAHAPRQSRSLAPGGRRLRSSLVVVEVALAVLLATGAALLVRSFQALLAVDPGFRSEQVLTFQLNAPDRLDDPAARLEFYRALFDRLESLPSVLAAGGTTRIPLGSPNVSTRVEVEGAPPREGPWPEVEFRRAMHQYFETMGIPVLRGRSFIASDAAGPPVAIVNDTMARQLFGAEDPVGRRIRMQPSPGPWMTIVGVVGSVRHRGLDEIPLPELYVDYARNPPVAPFVVLRTAVPPVHLIDVVSREVRALDPAAAPYQVRTLEEVRGESVAERRFTILLMSVFGLAALLLAAAGVYGIAALVTAERTPEIGVRMALGARPRSVVALIVRQSCMLAGLGALAGMAAAAAAAPLIGSQLFGIGAHDPLTFAIVPLLLVAVAALASLGPASRAARVDPLLALRRE